MSDGTLPTITRQTVEAVGRSRKGAVSGKLKVALDLMVWSGKRRAEAAEAAGLADASVRFSMRKVHVMAYYNAELAALRNSLRAKNIHRLDELGDQREHKMAAVAAIKTLEQIADQAEATVRHPGSQQVAGLVIVVRTGGGAPDKLIGPAAPPVIEGHATQRVDV